MKNVAAEGPRLVLYADEFTPGNALRPDSGRSTCAVYYTFENFPEWWRCRQEGWMTLGCLRTQKIEELECGMSTLMVAILDIFFNGRFPLDVGITLKSQGEDFTLRIPRVSTVVADFKHSTSLWGLVEHSNILQVYECVARAWREEPRSARPAKSGQNAGRHNRAVQTAFCPHDLGAMGSALAGLSHHGQHYIQDFATGGGVQFRL